MRLRLSIIYGAFCAFTSALTASADTSVSGSNEEGDSFTVFNEIRVPSLLELEGNKVNDRIQDGYWFIKHYSPWCPHCRAMAPVWQTLYEFYYTSKPIKSLSVSSESNSTDNFTTYYNFHFGSLNCDAYGSACVEHDIKAYPTFVFFKNGKETGRIEGSRDMKTLGDFIESQLELIQPGSRPKGGPTLPTVGAKTSQPDTKSVAEQKTEVDPPTTVNSHTIAPSPSVISQEIVSKIPSKGSSNSNHIPFKSTKPLSHPNTLGTSISLTTEKFQSEVTMSQNQWLIKFYVPWCGHCQALEPNWIQLAKEMKGRLNIGEVNCEIEKRLCKDVQLEGFPTILFFRGGERVEYNGLRGLGDLITYANKAIEACDGVKDINEEQFKALEQTEEVIFVYFYDHATTSEDFAALERLTLSLIGHAKLVKTNSKELVDRFKINTWPRLLVSRDGRPTYYTALSPQEMRDFRRVFHWMHSVWLPIVPELTASNAKEIMNGKLVVLAILTRDRPDEFLMAKKELKNAALEWMDKQTIAFQRERQELRDAKQLRIEEAEDRNDQRSLRSAKNIRINMDKSEQKEVGFAWVDGVFWERWIRQTYGIEVGKDGEKVIINDEDNHCYWDTTITGNAIIPSRTSILETIPKVVSSPPKIKAKSTISKFEKFFFDIRAGIREHPYLTGTCLLGIIVATLYFGRDRERRSRAGFFRLDDKDKLIGNVSNGKVD